MQPPKVHHPQAIIYSQKNKESRKKSNKPQVDAFNEWKTQAYPRTWMMNLENPIKFKNKSKLITHTCNPSLHISSKLNSMKDSIGATKPNSAAQNTKDKIKLWR